MLAVADALSVTVMIAVEASAAVVGVPLITPAVVMLTNGEDHIVIKRETYADMISNEI